MKVGTQIAPSHMLPTVNHDLRARVRGCQPSSAQCLTEQYAIGIVHIHQLGQWCVPRESVRRFLPPRLRSARARSGDGDDTAAPCRPFPGRWTRCSVPSSDCSGCSTSRGCRRRRSRGVGGQRCDQFGEAARTRTRAASNTRTHLRRAAARTHESRPADSRGDAYRQKLLRLQLEQAEGVVEPNELRVLRLIFSAERAVCTLPRELLGPAGLRLRELRRVPCRVGQGVLLHNASSPIREEHATQCTSEQEEGSARSAEALVAASRSSAAARRYGGPVSRVQQRGSVPTAGLGVGSTLPAPESVTGGDTIPHDSRARLHEFEVSSKSRASCHRRTTGRPRDALHVACYREQAKHASELCEMSCCVARDASAYLAPHECIPD